MNENHLTIIAGPCSIDSENSEEALRVAEMPGVNGVRVVGLKSRTALDESGKGMGIDYEGLRRNQQILLEGGGINDFVKPPSIEIAKELYEQAGVLIATEIMDPHLQMSHYKGVLPERKLLAWLPSVNQLGWSVDAIGLYSTQNNWLVGIKNGKWTGGNLLGSKMNSPYEATWKGLSTFSPKSENTVLIHRGFDIPGKCDYRNIPIHEMAIRVKKETGLKMMFDPSHSYGPKMRDQIVEGTIAAMQMKMSDGSFLYDGILIEAGSSKTDTKQHITLPELDELIDRLGQFRNLAEF